MPSVAAEGTESMCHPPFDEPDPGVKNTKDRNLDFVPRVIQIPRYVSSGLTFEQEVDGFVKRYAHNNKIISCKYFEEIQPYPLSDLAYDILMATFNIKSCASSRHIRSKIGFPDHARFLVRFHETYLELKFLYEAHLEFEPLYEKPSSEEMQLLFAFKVAYRICQPLLDHKIKYLETEGDELNRQRMLMANEFSKMRAKLTSGHGRKEPVRFDAILKAFSGRELSTLLLDELSDYFAGSHDRDNEKNRKYISSSVSWFNKHAEDLGIEIRIEAEKVTRYYIRLIL